MNQIIGTYECKIDDKGRLKVPTSLVKQMGHFADASFVVKRSVFQECLEVYPPDAWDKVMAKLNKLNRFVKKNADFIRIFTAGVKVVEFDSSGRILIPKDLTNFAHLEKETVITSAGEIFEIWDKETYEKIIYSSEIDFATLAEEVMGSENVEDHVS